MTHNKFKILVMFGLSSFLVPFMSNSIHLALPIIGKAFDMNIVSISWIVTTFLLATAVLLVPFGRLADILGRRKVFITGLIVFASASLLCGCAPSSFLLLTARLLQGVGGAMIFGTSTAILISLIPPQERGRALGINVSGVYLGSSLGPVLGGAITQYLGWRYIFIFIALMSTIVTVMAISYLQDEWAHAKEESFDTFGSLIYALATIALLYGPTMLPGTLGYIILFSSIILFAIFCIIERQITHPVFDINLLFKNKAFATASLAALLNFSAAFGVPFLMSLYMQTIRGLLPSRSGLIMLASAITMAIGAPLAGRLSDRKDPRILASIGMGIAACALLGIGLFLSPTTPTPLIILLLFVFGSGMSLFATPNTHAAMQSVTPQHLGMASSLINSMRIFGQTMSMGIATLIMTIMVGKVKISPVVYPQLMLSIKITFCVSALLCTIGALASLARGKQGKQEEKI